MLGIDTRTPGDIYLVRRTQTPFNRRPTMGTIIGYEFSSELVASRQDALADNRKVQMVTLEMLHDTPIVCSEHKTLTMLLMQAPSFVVYCDPKVHG